MRRPSREAWSRAALVLGAVAASLALVAGYARHALGEADQFAYRATSALQAEPVRQVIAERVTDELILPSAPDAQAGRPIILAVVGGVVGSPPFASLFRRGVADVHAAVIDGDRDTVALTLKDVGVLATEGVRRAAPDVADAVDERGQVALARERLGALGGTLARAVARLRALAWILLGLAVAGLAGSVALARDRRAAITRAGWGVTTGALVVWAALELGRLVAMRSVGGEDADAAGAVWDAFLGDLRIAALVLAATSAVVAAAAASLIRPVSVEEPLLRVGRALLRPPARPALQVARALGAVAAGLLLILEAAWVLRVAIVLVGIWLVYRGLEWILRLVYRPPEERAAAARADAPGAAGPGGEPAGPGGEPATPSPRAGWRSAARPVAFLAIVATLVAAGAVAFVDREDAEAEPPPLRACNGSAALCDRPLARVALAATHNSMSAPGPRWFATQQDAGLPEQLRDGIHGLLIDVFGAEELPNGNVRTDAERAPLIRNARAGGLSEQAIAAGLRLRERAGFRGRGRRDLWMCHGFCELGASELDGALRAIRDHLVSAPHEVLVVVVEDNVPAREVVGRLAAAGLDEFAYAGPIDSERPTLRGLIAADRRLVVFAENDAGGPAWYRPAFTRTVQETPFAFGEPEQLTDPAQVPASCARNRGPAGAPLFLINHWITTDPLPLPSNAARVNARRPLLRRARECGRRRDRMPGLIAVDFYRRGDLFEVVEELNRRPPAG